MSTPDKTLLVNGTDLQTLVIITDPNCLRAPGIRRGDPDVVPLRRGRIGADLALDSYPFTVPVAIAGTNAADLEANIAALGVLLAAGTIVGGRVSLERRLPKAGGGHNSFTAAGFFEGFANWSFPGDFDVAVDLQFLNLDGGWFDGTNWIVP